MKLFSIINKPVNKAGNKQAGIVFLEYVIMAFIATVAVVCAIWWLYWHLQQMTWEIKDRLKTLPRTCPLETPYGAAPESQPTAGGGPGPGPEPLSRDYTDTSYADHGDPGHVMTGILTNPQNINITITPFGGTGFARVTIIPGDGSPSQTITGIPADGATYGIAAIPQIGSSPWSLNFVVEDDPTAPGYVGPTWPISYHIDVL